MLQQHLFSENIECTLKQNKKIATRFNNKTKIPVDILSLFVIELNLRIL